MSNLGEAIRKARKAQGMTLEAVAEIVGSDTGNLSRLERGKQGVSQELLQKILEVLGLSLAGVLESSVMRRNADEAGILSSNVPVISWVQISDWMDTMQTFAVADAQDWVPCPVEHGPRTFALRVTGESMRAAGSSKSFSPGDFIYVDPDKPHVNGSYVVARVIFSIEPVFRQLVLEGGVRYLQATNPAWPERIRKLSDADEVVGTVIFKGEVL